MMKKAFVGLSVIASMALIGCNQEEQFLVNQDGNEVFKASLEVNSRTYLGENKEIVWDADDQIVIFKKTGYKQRYKLANGMNTIIAQFAYDNYSEELNSTLDYNYAVYPFSENHELVNNETVSFNLDLENLAEQNFTEKTFEDGKSVMTAKSATTDLFFYNALSMLRVKLNAGAPGDEEVVVGSIKITSSNNALSGPATIDMSEEKPVAKFTDTDNNEITLSCKTPVTLERTAAEGGHEFYILVPATTFAPNDLTITILDKDGKTIYESVYSKELECLRSQITTIEHTFGEIYDCTIEKEKITLNLDDLKSTDFEDNKVYALSGTLLEDLTINVPQGLNIIFDGSAMNLGEKHLIFQTNANWPDHVSSIERERKGEVTYQNFQSGVLSIKTAHTTVNVLNNKLEALDIAGGNMVLNVKGNVIDGKNQVHKRYDGGNTDMGIYIYTAKYELSFENNEIGNTVGGALSINGWGHNPSWDTETNTNSITSFTNNSFEVTEEDVNDPSAAITFMGDCTYYCVDHEAGTISTGAESFMEMVKNGNNTFTKETGVTKAYQFKFIEKTAWNSVKKEEF